MRCYKCKGTKWRDKVVLADDKVLIDEKAAEYLLQIKKPVPIKWSGVFRCKCAPDERVKEFMSGLPLAYQGFDKDYPVMVIHGERIDMRTKALKLIDEHQILIFCGGTGNGKTWVSVNIAVDWLRQGKSVIFVEATELAKYYFGSQGGRGFRVEESGDEYMMEVDSHTHIIVNDLGVGQSGNPNFRECLRLLFDNMTKVIISTNLPSEKPEDKEVLGIKEIYGETVTTYLKTLPGQKARAKILEKDFNKIGDRR